MIHICSILGSERGVREFRLLHGTALRWGEYQFLVGCPPQFAGELAVLPDVLPIPLISPALIHQDGERRDYYGLRCRKLLRGKIDISREAIRRFGYAFYMDVDTIVVSPLPDPLLSILDDYDVLASPHFVAPSMASACGAHNAGMFLTAKQAFLSQWEQEMEQESAGFGDQTAFNRVVQASRTFDLPMTYNVGWWRYSAEAAPFCPIQFHDGQFFVDDRSVYNFHLRLSTPTELSRLVGKLVLTSDAHPELRAAITLEQRQRLCGQHSREPLSSLALHSRAIKSQLTDRVAIRRAKLRRALM